ncbi:MAG: FAD-dependent oxidoreductase, partial [Candidatus Melainabacteria bacterium]|nr:FAD-dependent oxidoreductase [Candidatus Melainabacteria bacterium]
MAAVCAAISQIMNSAKTFIERDFCVVGAGFAGLTAALRLTQAGYCVIVVEARDRIGGKVWTKYLADGTPIDLGGTFVGPTQDRIYALLEEMGLEITPTPIHGDSLLIYDGKVHRYGVSDKTPDIDSKSLAGVWEVLQLLSRMSQEVPNQAPWTCARAKEWDSMSLGQFINDPVHGLTEPARAMLRTLFIGLFTCELSDISLLFVLFQIAASGNDIEMQMRVEGGAEQDMVKGGMSCIAEKMKEKIGDCFLLSSAVRHIIQNQDSVTVISDKATIKAQRVVVAVPPNLANNIDYTPPLPSTRMELLRHMPAGQCIKFITVYDQSFWRKDGLSGEVTAPDEFIQMTLDTSPPDQKVGALMSFSFAKEAMLMAEMSADERNKHLLDALVRRFGARAGKPMHYFEHDWSRDRWTRGCHVAHLAPGVLTSYGHVVREPFGR